MIKTTTDKMYIWLSVAHTLLIANIALAADVISFYIF